MSIQDEGRPSRAPRLWASDTTIVAPGEPWDAALVRRRASDGYAAQGFHPGARVLPGALNHELYDHSARLSYLDMLDATNWKADMGAAFPVSGSTGGEAYFAEWRGPELASLYVVYEDSDIKVSRDGGYHWTNLHTDAGASWRDVAATSATVAAVGTEGGAAKVREYHISGGSVSAGSTVALTGATDCRCIVADPYLTDVFWVGGSGGGATKILRLSSSCAVEANRNPLSGTNRIDVIAPGPTIKMGAVLGVASASNVLYRWADGDVNAAAVTSPTASAIVDLVYVPAYATWVLFTASQVWISTSGLTGSWSNLSAFLPVITVPTFLFRGGTARGSLLLAAVGITGGGGLLVSGDCCLSWQCVPDPLGPYVSPVANVTQVQRVGNRFIAIGHAAPSEFRFAFGLRTGPMRT